MLPDIQSIQPGEEILLRVRVIRNDHDTLVAIRGSLISDTSNPGARLCDTVEVYIPWDDITGLVTIEVANAA